MTKFNIFKQSLLFFLMIFCTFLFADEKPINPIYSDRQFVYMISDEMFNELTGKLKLIEGIDDPDHQLIKEKILVYIKLYDYERKGGNLRGLNKQEFDELSLKFLEEVKEEMKNANQRN